MKIQLNLLQTCKEIIRLCEHKCLPLSANTESKVFFLKMIGDYHRYSAESFHSSDHKSVEYLKFVAMTKQYYKKGLEKSFSDLHPCNPLRLGLTLNYSIFLKEFETNSWLAIVLAQQALQAAQDKIDDSGSQTLDCKRIMEQMS